MKKYIALAIISLLVVSSVYASIGVKKDDVYLGAARDINISRGSSGFNGETVTFYGSGLRGGVTANVSTESSLTSAALAYGVIDIRIGSAKTIGLSNGVTGQMISIVCTVRDAKNVIIRKNNGSVSCTTTGWNTITFDTVLDSITLLYVDDTVGWVIIANNGCTVA